jgi:hypothetical protein
MLIQDEGVEEKVHGVNFRDIHMLRLLYFGTRA